MSSGATAALGREYFYRLLGPALVLLAWLALSLAALTLLWVVRRRAVNRTGDTLCAACGYNLRALPGDTCPECGNDLRRHDGVVRPGWPYSTETLARLVQWTILVPLAGLVLSGLLAMFLELRTAVRRLTLDLPRGQPGSVYIDAAGEGYSRPVRMDRLVVELTDARSIGPPVEVEVQADTLRYREAGTSRGWSAGPLDADIVAGWLARAGLDATSPEGRADAQELVSLIRSTAADQEWHPAPARFRVRGRDTSAGSRTRDPTFRFAAAGFWAVVWLAGVIWTLKRRGGGRRRT